MEKPEDDNWVVTWEVLYDPCDPYENWLLEEDDQEPLVF